MAIDEDQVEPDHYQESHDEAHGVLDHVQELEDDGFDFAVATRLLAGNLFLVYCGMVMLLQNIPKRAMSWMEACSCHDYGHEAGSNNVRQQRI